MRVKDYFLTQEEFQIVDHKMYDGIKITQPMPAELDRYYDSENYISHNTTKKGIIARLYRIAQNYNRNYKLNILKKHSNRKDAVLEYGAGQGDFLANIYDQYKSAYWYEPHKQSQDTIATNTPNAIQTTARLDNIADDSLDVIYLWHVLEHTTSPDRVLQMFHNKLKPEGKLFIAIPNYQAFDARFYGKFWAAWDVPRHLHHFSRQGIIQLAGNNSLIFNKDYPLWLDAFYISLLSSKYSNNLLYKLSFPIIGLISNLLGIFSSNYSSNLYVFSKKTS